MLRLLLKLLGVVALAGLVWVLLVTAAPSSWVASGAPCPRNLGWGAAWMPRDSPLESLEIRLPTGRARLCYGSPSLKGRRMLGEHIPYGELWRLGANEPTTLHLSRLVNVGDLVLAPGSYSLYAIPGAREWEIVFNRSTRQWGLESEYTEEVRALEVGRIRVQAQKLDSPVEKMRFRAQPSALGAVELVFEWQDTRWRLPLDTTPPELTPEEMVDPVTDV